MRSTMGNPFALLTVTGVLFMSEAARAAPPSMPDPNDAAVQRYFQEGLSAAAAKRHDEAARSFRAAWALSKDPAIGCNIGHAEFRRKDYAAAAEFLTRCQEIPREKGDELTRAEELSELKQSLDEVGAIRVEVAEPQAEIVIDDRVVGRGGVPQTFFVSPGPHRIRARVDERSAEKSIIVEKGSSRTVALTIEPAEPAATIEKPKVASGTGTLKSLAPIVGPVKQAEQVGPLATKPGPAVVPVSGADAASRMNSTLLILITGGATIAATLGNGIGFTAAAEDKRAATYDMTLPMTELPMLPCPDNASQGLCGEYHTARADWKTYNTIASASFVASGFATAITAALLVANHLTVKPTVTLGGLGVQGSW